MTGKTKLKRMYISMSIMAVIMLAIKVTTIVIWINQGVWLPFAIGMSVNALIAINLVRIYYKNTAYICPQCDTKFKPKLIEFLLANHTPKTRKLTCSNCDTKSFCIESYSD